MVHTTSLDLDHIAQVQVTPLVVGVESLVGRRDRPGPETAVLNALAGSDPHDPFRWQSDRDGVIDQRLGDDKSGGRRRGHQVGQRPRIDVV